MSRLASKHLTLATDHPFDSTAFLSYNFIGIALGRIHHL